MPCGSTGISTINSSPGLNGMELLRKTGGGTKDCFLFQKSCSGCHSSFYLILLIRSHIVSKTMPHSNGPGAPPNVRGRLIRAKFNSGIWVTVFTAVAWWRCIWWYADMTSSFLARFLLFGNFLLATMAQFISLDRHVLNLHHFGEGWCRFLSWRLCPKKTTQSSGCVSVCLFLLSLLSCL